VEPRAIKRPEPPAHILGSVHEVNVDIFAPQLHFETTRLSSAGSRQAVIRSEFRRQSHNHFHVLYSMLDCPDGLGECRVAAPALHALATLASYIEHGCDCDPLPRTRCASQARYKDATRTCRCTAVCVCVCVCDVNTCTMVTCACREGFASRTLLANHHAPDSNSSSSN
jgi:hypothetical protein